MGEEEEQLSQTLEDLLAYIQEQAITRSAVTRHVDKLYAEIGEREREIEELEEQIKEMKNEINDDPLPVVLEALELDKTLERRAAGK